MTQDPEELQDPELEAALRGCARPRARAEFELTLRERFVSPAAARPRVVRAWIPLAAAAALLLAGWIVFRVRPTRWEVVEGPGLALDALDRRGGELQTVSDGVVLRYGDQLLLDVAPNSRVRFAGSNPHDLQVIAGHLRVRTGPGLRGARLRVAADVLDIAVVGTAFAIDYEAEGTCVCCLHGTVEVSRSRSPGDPRPLTADRMCFVFRDERECAWGSVPDVHGAPLKRLEEIALRIWP